MPAANLTPTQCRSGDFRSDEHLKEANGSGYGYSMTLPILLRRAPIRRVQTAYKGVVFRAIPGIQTLVK